METLSISNIFFMVLSALLFEQLTARPQPNDIEEMKKALMNVCSKKHPLTEKMISDTKKGVFSDERDLKCFLWCMFDEVSMIDEDGVIDADSMVSMGPDDMKPFFVQATNTCIPIISGKPDVCEISFNFVKCAFGINPLLVGFS